MTSYQPFSVPLNLDHYQFWQDNTVRDTFTYPNTANGSDFTYSSGQPGVTADDGLFTPWDYFAVNTTQNIGIGPFKGPYTINFDPTGLDVSELSIIKIIYNFGDGTERIVNRSINPHYTIGQTESAGDPNAQIISHDYYPQNSSGITIYTPSITAYNSNIIRNVFNVTISSAPISIYEFDDFHLINNTQQLTATETQNIFEIEQPDYLTLARVLSTVDVNHPTVLPFDPNSSILNYDLITWLDASDATTISKDKDNNVLTWYDKSAYKNNYFGNLIGQDTPVFLYPRESESARKCVHFTNGKFLYAVASGTLGDKIFYTYGQGYTMFAVAKLNSIGSKDTLFAYDLNLNEEYNSLRELDNGNGKNYLPYLNISFSNAQNNSIIIEQGDTSYYQKTSAGDPNGIYQPTVIDNISQNINNYSLYSVTISGNQNANTYFTADTYIARRKNQNYQNYYNTLSSFLSGGFNPSTVLYPPTGQDIPAGTYDYRLVYGLLGTSDAYYDSYLTDTELSEFMLFDRPLNPTEISIVQKYLIQKWDLTLQTS